MVGLFQGTAAVALTLALATGAQAASYAISWTGANDYSMTGSFSFSDALLGNVITYADLDDLEISLFQGAALFGSRSLSADGPGSYEANFNFNFDSATGVFLTGGLSSGPNGQNWFSAFQGNPCDTVGFTSGSINQGVCFNVAVGVSFIPTGESTLTAQRLDDPAVIPLPAALPLLAGGLLGLALLGRRRHA